MAFSFPLSLPLSALNRKLVLFIRITILNWPLLGYPHALPHFPLLLKTSSSLQRCLTDHKASSIEECSESQTDKCQSLFSRWGNWGLESSGPPGKRTCGSPGSRHGFLRCDCDCSPTPPPPHWAWAPSRHAILPWLGGKSPLSEWQESLEKHFPSLKGFGRKLAQLPKLCSSLASPGPLIVLGTSPVPRAPTPSEEGKGPEQNPPTLPGLAAPKVTSPYFCFSLFHFQSIEGSHTKSFKVRRAQGQVQPWANPELRILKLVLKQRSHSLVKPLIAQGELHTISVGITRLS